ncbi:MAG: type II toxin-antitoxin system RelE/ParE family toxin [Methylocella sp.]
MARSLTPLPVDSLHLIIYMVFKRYIMPDRTRIPVVFYSTASGSVPVLDWMRELDREDRRRIGLDLLRVQENWPIGMPVCRSLGEGLWEVRNSLQNGRIARLIFTLHRGEIYVLHGFFKKTQKTPPQDMVLARRRMKEVLA